ncbi:MAG: lysophospholipid acyltransferase family protein [Myxococcota bacterium]
MSLSRLRFSTRALRATLSTASHWGRMEVARAAAPAPRKHRTLMLRVPRWARHLCEIFGLSLKTSGPFIGDGRPYPTRSAEGVGRIFIMNHRSGLDVPVMLALVEGHLVSRADLAQWPFIGHGARRIGTLFVDRASLRSGATVQREMERHLADGHGVALFPEGTAFDGDEIRPFRPGAFRAAARTGAELVPLGIAYDRPEAYFGDESFLDHMQRVMGLPALGAAVVAGEPWSVPADARVTQVRERAREVVGALVKRARAQL